MRIVRKVVEKIKHGTTIAVLIHPPGDEQNPVCLSPMEGKLLGQTLRELDKYLGTKGVAVFAADTLTVAGYAKIVTDHFSLREPVRCNALLCKGDPKDARNCISDYLSDEFDLLVLIVAEEDAKEILGELRKYTRRTIEPLFVPALDACVLK